MLKFKVLSGLFVKFVFDFISSLSLIFKFPRLSNFDVAAEKLKNTLPSISSVDFALLIALAFISRFKFFILFLPSLAVKLFISIVALTSVLSLSLTRVPLASKITSLVFKKEFLTKFIIPLF